MNTDFQNVKAIFLAAVEKPSPAERDAYLTKACGGDAAIREQVEALLRRHDAAGSFLNQPAADRPEHTEAFTPEPAEGQRPVPTTDYQPAAEPGAVIAGRYTLVEKIGEGGMGEVWVAKQTEPVKRKVALKLIKAGMDSKAVLTRFEHERQALAMMEHPNIARVLDGGMTADRRPFFVMELVNGLPLTKFCDEAKLGIRERLELFAAICQAVQHAHQKGIIHRDLKPSNILVTLIDAKPVPKVIDFGVAKAIGGKLLDESLSTQFGAVVGTLEYMAPEQAGFSGSDIDTRADIYSLGVILYELLTGLRPLDAKRLKKAAYTEMIRIIQEEEPSKPSTRLSTDESLPSLAALRHIEPKKLMALLRGELDWVVMKCLEKQRERRYETANALARDVQRYLADEAVEARPPSAGYRLGKFLKRNKGPVIAASVILLCLLAGIISTSAGLVWAIRERDDKGKALLAEIKEREDKEKALAAETKARAAEKQARDQTLAALRSMTDDIVENQMARGTQLTEENKEFLRKIIKHFEGFAAITAADADSRSIRAEGYARVGLMRARLGEMQGAETAFAEALVLQKQLAADFPTRPEFRQELAMRHNNLGALLTATGRLKEAAAAFADALALQKQLAADFPTRPEFRQDLAASHNNLGLLLRATGRLQEAEAAFADALALYKQLAADFPTRPEFRRELALSHNYLGVLLSATGRLREAAAAYADALALRKQLAADFPTRPEFRQDLAASHNNLGSLLSATGRLKEAAAAYADALALQKQLAADFPTRPEFRQELALSHNNLGALLTATGRLKEAAAAYADALALQKQLAADFPNQPDRRNDVAGTLVNLAILCNQRQDFAAAKARLDEAEAHHQAALKANPRHPTYRQFYRNNLLTLAGANAGLLDQAGAVRAAERIRDLGWDPPGNAYDAACALSLCIPIVQKDHQATTEERDKQAAFYGDEAMKMLRDAVAKGHNNAAHIKQDKDLDPLRDRDDFKELLAELEKKAEKK